MTKSTKYALAISLTLFVVLITLVWALKTPWAEKTPLGIPSETTSSSNENVRTIDDLLDAIEQVESGGDANAVGDGGEAVGAYQLHRIYIDDLNRILALDGSELRFTYLDRWDREISRIGTELYMRFWCRHYYFFIIDSGMSVNEAMARIHNGGPDGWRKESTKAYWQKVRSELVKEP